MPRMGGEDRYNERMDALRLALEETPGKEATILLLVVAGEWN